MDPLTKLYVELTSRCNLSCQMCIQRVWTSPNGDLPFATFCALIDSLRDLSAMPIVHLGGYGEPLFYRHFLDAVRYAKDAGARVEVTTNGTLLTPETSAALIDAGLDRLVVSLDGVTPQSYEDVRVNGDLHDVIGNLRDLFRQKIRRAGKHSKPHVEIAFVAMKRNIADLPELPRLATQIGAWNVNVSNVIPHTPEMEREILYERALTDCVYRATRWAVDVSLPKLDLNDDTLDPLAHLWRARSSITMLHTSLSARNDYCQFAQEGYAVVRSDGAVSPCLSLLYDHPEYVRGRRRQIAHHAFGNIHDTPLPELWESPAFAGFREKLRTFDFSPCSTCGGCERFPRNEEDCTEHTFPTCGGCLWAQGFISCP
jgi:MoaA/NifB/PqqE/SkfB family radical SAM enzyme